MRVRNAQTYAAISVASVAAAIAAIAASTATVSNEDNQNKTNFAVASAATLVAAQCVEIAERMGADHEQMSAVVSSAVNVRTSGDVMTLTAAAATALRAVATLKARTLRQHRSTATVIPYERGNCDAMTFSGELSTDESESDYGSHEVLRRGCDFLKRTRKGALHWRWVSVFLNKHLQLIVKSQSKHMKGTITKTRTRLLREVITDMPAWPEREYANDGIHERRYFGIKTDHGVMELECKNEAEYRMWTEGITRLLSLVQRI
ncbi:hypothetical protein KP509_29G086900 [Ceratopteris richardii]|nr:hypothetical protein KP509_29G086900 [Ceratopteris richardii]